MNVILLWFYKKYNGEWDKIYKALEEKEKVSLVELNKIENELKDYTTILDVDYPNDLKETYKPPFVFKKKATYTINEEFNYNFVGDIFKTCRG